MKSPLWLKLLAVVTLLAGVAVALSFVPSGYVAVEPHKPIDMRNRLRIDGRQPEPPHGHLFLVGVSEEQVGMLQRWLLSFDKRVTLEQAPSSSQQRQSRRRDEQAIAESKDVAAAAAYRLLGERVTLTGLGAIVSGVEQGGPADRAGLKRGDRLVRVQGQRVRTMADVTRVVTASPPGTRLEFAVRRDNLPLIVQVTAGKPRRGDTLHRSRIGVLLTTPGLKIGLPHRVDVATGRVIGPSAGLAFALAVYDAASAVDLLRGRYVVATGALALDGEVLPVGGVRQKAIATQEAGHDLLLVPRQEIDTARTAIREFCKAGADCTQVLGVASVADAVAALKLGSTQLDQKLAK